MLIDFTTFDGMKPEEFAAFAEARMMNELQNPVRLGERILPTRRTNSYKVVMGRIHKRQVASPVIAPNAELPRPPEFTTEEREASILKIGMKKTFNETELKVLWEMTQSRQGITPDALMDSAPWMTANYLVEGYLDAVERIRWELLDSDAYTIPRTSIVISWNVPSVNKMTLTGTARWDDYVNADGLADLQEMNRNAVARYGRPITTYVMSTTEFNHLISQTKTQNKMAAIGAFGMAPQINANIAGSFSAEITPGMLSAYLNRSRTGLGGNVAGVTIQLYDKQYGDFDFYGNSQPVDRTFLKVNKVVGITAQPIDGPILPNMPQAGAIGYAYDGPVVENNFRSGLHLWSFFQKEPVEAGMASVAWTFPIADPRQVHQLTTFTV